MDNQFIKGDRVEMTDDARKIFPNAKRTGVVKSLLGAHTVRILRDGVKQPETWSEKFWRRSETVSWQQK